MVLNWNGAELLRRHLPSVIEAARMAPVDARVYVIDNASRDSSRDVVGEFPGVELISYEDNRKLHAYNAAVREVECTAFMMLNNDLSPGADVIAPMWHTMSADSSVFAVGGDVIDTATKQLDSGPTAARWERQWVLEPAALAGATKPVDVAYVSGGAGLYRREMFLALDGFWDALPGLYWEDVELGLRAWLHGWRSVFQPGLRFDHESGTTVRRSLNPYWREFRTYQNVRLTHYELLLDPPDLRNYLLGELRRSLRKPYYYLAALSLLPWVREIRSRRRQLRRQCGAVRVADLQLHWRARPGGQPTSATGSPPAAHARKPSQRR
jgi:GT2 family glycosyltransferase